MKDRIELRGAKIALYKPSYQAAATDGLLREIVDKRGICIEASGKTAEAELGPAKGKATDGKIMICAVEARKPESFFDESGALRDRSSKCE